MDISILIIRFLWRNHIVWWESDETTILYSCLNQYDISVWNIEILYVVQSMSLHFCTLCWSHISVLTSKQNHFWVAIAQRNTESQHWCRYVFLWMTIFATNQQQRVKTDDDCKSQLQFASTALNIYWEFLRRSIFATN